MNNNDVLRRVRYILDLSDDQMMATFAAAEHPVTRTEVSAWLKKDEDPDLEPCSNVMLATFLNGLINRRRGKKEGPQPAPETRLSNNMIFMKLRIAFDLKADGVLEILGLTEFMMSRHELSALFRKPNHKHYRECQDQVLRNFLRGLQIKLRPDAA